MPWQNVYLNSNSSVPVTSHSSVMGRLSVASNVSITGTLNVVGGIAGASAFSGAAVSATSATFSGAVAISGGTAITRLGGSRRVVTNLTLTATKSTETTWADNLVAQGDLIWGSPTSAISEGIAWNFVASANSLVRLRLSNCSVANASQDSSIWNYWHIKP